MTQTGWRARLPVVMGVLAGVAVVVQSRVNGALELRVHNGVASAMANFGIGLVLVSVGVFVLPKPRAAMLTIPAQLRGAKLRWWHLLGGVGGASFIASQSVSVPAIGVALFTVATVAGQSSSGLLVDRLGLGPGGVRPVSKARLVAAAMSIVAVALAVSGRIGTSHSVVAFVGITLAAAVVTSFQQAFNGRVALASSPSVAALANFATGFLALSITVSVMILGFSQHVSWPSPLAHPALYLGGPLGLFFITSAAYVVRSVGVLLFMLTAIAGQLAGALILDVFFPTPGAVVTWQLFSGVILTGVAVAIAALRNN